MPIFVTINVLKNFFIRKEELSFILTEQSKMKGIVNGIKMTVNIIKYMLIITIVVTLLCFPPLFILLVVGRYILQVFVLPKLIRSYPNGIKEMPQLIPFLCIPLPFKIKWKTQWVHPDDPINGQNPENAAFKKGFSTHWSFVNVLLGETSILLTNEIEDSGLSFRAKCKQCQDPNDKHKGTVLYVPYIVANELAKTWQPPV